MTTKENSIVNSKLLEEFTLEYLKEHEELINFVKKETEKQLRIGGVGNCNCDNGNDFFEEQYVLQHLINDTWQVVGEKTNTVWKQGTKEICQEWLDL